jgi:hypothetical protein
VNNLYANNPAGTNTITPASINALATNATLQANTDVTITDAIAMTNAGVTLTMQAGRSVLINNDVSTNNGAISVTSNDPGALLANRAAGAGSITMGTRTSRSPPATSRAALPAMSQRRAWPPPATS